MPAAGGLHDGASLAGSSTTTAGGYGKGATAKGLGAAGELRL